MKKSDILNRAAEILMERGHAKGELVDAEGRVCIEGACQLAADESGRGSLSYHGVFEPLRAVVGQFLLFMWNDHPETTEAMALGALHQAAILAKEQGD